MPRIIVKEDVCKGCELCVNACPKRSLRFVRIKSMQRATTLRSLLTKRNALAAKAVQSCVPMLRSL